MGIFGMVSERIATAKARRAGISPAKYKEYMQKTKKERFIKAEEAKRKEYLRRIKETEKVKTDEKLKYIKEGGFKGKLKRGLKQHRKKMKGRGVYTKPTGGTGPNFGLSRDITALGGGGGSDRFSLGNRKVWTGSGFSEVKSKPKKKSGKQIIIKL